MTDHHHLSTACRPAELAVIVPTYKEADNVAEIVARVSRVLDGVDWEILFVDDDSPDGTSDRVREIARRDPRVRLVQRIGRRGLSSACIKGMMASSAAYLAVINGDLQHDETLLPRMLEALKDDRLDLVVGSRYVDGGGIGAWDQRRQSMSRFAGGLARRLVKVELQDPMSGFFMLRADVLRGCVRRLSGVGYKILLDIVAEAEGPLKVREIPYTFRERQVGDSKLDNAVLWEYLLMLAQKTIGPFVPVRFIAFSLIGGLGVGVHMLVLLAVHKWMGLSFVIGQTTATIVAMVGNFFLNNVLTYRDMPDIPHPCDSRI